MAKSPFGSLADLIAQLGVQPEQPKPQEPGVETPKPQDPDKPKPEVPQSDLGKVFDKKATFTLTNKADKVAAKEGDKQDMVVEGKVSGLLAEATLNAKDKISGGEGADVLRAELKSSFSGFDTKVGGVKGIETIALMNKSKSAREFSAKGVEKAEEYILKGNINLKELDSVAKVALIDRAQDFTVKFADKVTDGKADELALSLQNVGKAKTAKASAIHTKITAANVEKLSLTTSGDNFVNNNVAASAVEVQGAGKLDFKTAATSIESFDASKMTGDLVADLSNVTKLDSLALGEGDDKVTLAPGSTTGNMVIAGGEGKDTLVLKGTAKTVQYQMTGVENVELGALSATMTFSAADTEGLETIVASKALNQDAKFVYLGEKDMALQLKGANASAKTITLDNSGATKVIVDTPAADLAADAFDTNSLKANLLASKSLALEVAEKMDYTGTITATETTEVSAAIKGKTTGAIINAGSAEIINITEVANDSSLTLTTPAALELNVASAKNLDISTASTLTKLQNLGATTQALFKTGALADLAQADLKGSGAVELGAIGGVTMEHGVAITAEGLKDIKNPAGAVTAQALKLAGITTKGEDINITTSNISGEVLLNGAISTTATSGSVTLNLQASKVNGSAADITAIESLEATINSDSTASLKNLSAKEITLNIKALETATVGTIDAADKVSAEINANDAVTLGVVGGTAAPKEATITINTLEAAAFSGAITADKLELDLAGVMGGATFGGALNIKESLTLNGSKLKGFDLSNTTKIINAKGEALEVTLNGGLELDKAKIALADAANTEKVTLKGDLGLGANTVEIDASAETDTAVTIDLSGFNAGMEGTVTVKVAHAQTNTIKLGSSSKEVVELTLNSTLDDTKKQIIEGFDVNNDKIKVGTLTVSGDATALTLPNPLTGASTGAFADQKLYTIDMRKIDISAKDFGEAHFGEIAKANGGYLLATAGTANNASALLVVVGENQTHVYAHKGGADTDLAEDEVTLVAVLKGSFQASDFTSDLFTIA